MKNNAQLTLLFMGLFFSHAQCTDMQSERKTEAQAKTTKTYNAQATLALEKALKVEPADVQAAKKAIDAGADINAPMPTIGDTPVSYIFASLRDESDIPHYQENILKILKLLLSNSKFDASASLVNGVVLRYGSDPKPLLEGLKLVLQHANTDPNFLTGGKTPLMYASYEAAELLTKHPKIKIDAFNNEGKTALALAVQNGNTKEAKLLLEAGANPDSKAKDSAENAYEIAQKKYKIALESDESTSINLMLELLKLLKDEREKYLLKRKVVAQATEELWKAINAQPADVQAAKKAIDAGADVNFVTHEETPLTYMMYSLREKTNTPNDIEILKLLLNHSDIDVNKGGLPPLFLASLDVSGLSHIKYDKQSQLEALKLLLQHPEIDLNVKAERGKTVLQDNITPEAAALIREHSKFKSPETPKTRAQFGPYESRAAEIAGIYRNMELEREEAELEEGISPLKLSLPQAQQELKQEYETADTKEALWKALEAQPFDLSVLKEVLAHNPDVNAKNRPDEHGERPRETPLTYLVNKIYSFYNAKTKAEAKLESEGFSEKEGDTHKGEIFPGKPSEKLEERIQTIIARAALAHDAVILLIKHGADPELDNDEGLNGYDLAHDNAALLQLLKNEREAYEKNRETT